MIINRSKNTKESGVLEILVYKDGNTFTGVCLTFDIILEGSDQTEVLRSIKDASVLHLETVIKNNLSDDLLNRYAPNAYWEKYFEATKQIEKKSSTNSIIVSPYIRQMTAVFA